MAARCTDLDVDDGSGGSARLPPALVLRGQYDFVSDDNARTWTEIFDQSQYMTLQNASHYGSLEQEDLYRDVLSAFLRDHDRSDDDDVDERNADTK